VSYDCVATVELDGCHLQGGEFIYEAGGPAGRTAKLRNCIFERSAIRLRDLNQNHGNLSETLTASNNLFYASGMWVHPVSGTTTWTFADNIFDQCLFHGDGPVTINTHNAYVAMTSHHLSPGTEAGPITDLASLLYDSGPLGNFYLPATATALLHSGSRSQAGQAGMYHFTSLTNNTKQQNLQLNIGPAYLALDSNGNPFDSNAGGPDGVPDFIADRNGDGTEEGDETPWATLNNGTLALLSPQEGSIVSDVIALRFNPVSDGILATTASVMVDGRGFSGATSVTSPGIATSELELDTKLLTDGAHQIAIAEVQPSSDPAVDEVLVQGPIRTVVVANNIKFPEWHDRADLAFSAIMEVPASISHYVVSAFKASFAKAYDPINEAYAGQMEGVPNSGHIACFSPPADLGLGEVSAGRNFYSVTELDSGSSTVAVANPGTAAVQPFPIVGLWVTAYGDDPVDYYRKPDQPMADPVVLPVPGLDNPWWHSVDFELAWYACGDAASGFPSEVAYPPGTSSYGQTWPLRTQGPFHLGDAHRLKVFLSCTNDSENFYGYGHGTTDRFLGIIGSDFAEYIQTKRFRFAFLAGCKTSSSEHLVRAFGATKDEADKGMTFVEIKAASSDPSSPTGPFRPSDYESPDEQHPNRLGIRPGLFLGYKYSFWAGHNYYPNEVQDYWTGKWCYYDKYAAYAHWESLLVYYWRDLNYPFLNAFAYATDDAAVPGYSWPPWDILSPVAKVDNVDVLFFPDTCVLIYGCGEMHFNDYNYFEDQW
jgi:hypothetical protein